ncbi:D-TA family PLP-dependent enzyme [Allosediminivita pacifica]|uniref:D-serine deaminase-like pyridoxal phosphate-dependent protein n=1 Tax=Allosediminivita pacifica TaxID=1267769 RepID=A0A2T6BAB3_9RHOB|nr:D-TA family PLP-dependent enzyme [Allosediminivita pacifica]PTX52966.1 D-serine deaminase-like pyridoxal phosphate-dependent protein [Allosediminivita pacifica]GGA94145.1 alanine racemase [Allosediminivita pacifica]
MEGIWPEAGTPLSEVLTPMPVIDEARMAANIALAQAHMDGLGRAFRPHIKTHKLPEVALTQLAAGAVGINCQKVTEAEVFADAGIADILITYNILGAARLARLKALQARVPRLAVTADNATTVAGLAATFDAAAPLRVLVECDTGGGRCGVQTPEAARDLAREIADAEGLTFGGLMTYPAPGGAAAVEGFVTKAKALLEEAGLGCPAVSVGGTPDFFAAGEIPSATEHRAGTYVYNDRAMVRAGHASEDDCAMHVLVTCVSRPTANRAVIDAGSKALTSDLLGFPDHGLIPDYPGARITGLSEEHGVVDLSGVEGEGPQVGEQLRIIPNHTCVVTNLFDRMVFHDGGVVTRVLDVKARGTVW